MAMWYPPHLEAQIRALGLLDPTARPLRQRRAAPPLDTLNGKRAGFLDNRKGNAEVLLERVRERLAERFDLAAAGLWAKRIYSAPADARLLEELVARCDFVVTAVGD